MTELNYHSGCSIVVVYTVWDRVVRVRFPAPRQNNKLPRHQMSRQFVIFWSKQEAFVKNG
jgi:hypothetical protein